MKKPWPKVKLGEVLRRSEQTILLQADREYHEITVRLWGKGVISRGIVTGAEIAGARRFLATKRQFILSRIDARNGASGIVPDELDGAVVSTDFPLFNLLNDQIDVEFLGWLGKTQGFVDLCRRASEGTTNRVRLQEDRFLSLEISLPPLAEQRRIVARIEELAVKIAEARSLRQQSAHEAESLWPASLQNLLVGQASLFSATDPHAARRGLLSAALRFSGSIFPNHNNAHPHQPKFIEDVPIQLPKGWAWTTLGSVLTHMVDCVNDTPDFADSDTGHIGLKSTNIRPYRLDMTRRWFMKPEDFHAWNRRETPQEKDVVLTREAPMGFACMIPSGCNVCLTQRLMLLRANTDVILPEMLLHYLNSPFFRLQVEDQCRGLTTPHIRVQDAPHFVLALPPLPEQRRIVAYLDGLQGQVDALKRLQAQTAAELDALLPSILDRAFKGEL